MANNILVQSQSQSQSQSSSTKVKEFQSQMGVTIHQTKKDSSASVSSSVVVDMEAVQNRIQNTIQHIYDEDDSPEAMRKLGIDTIQGRAEFRSKDKLQIFGSGSGSGSGSDSDSGFSSTVTAKYGVLICTGASPKDPSKDMNIPGITSIDYITYENAFTLKKVPKYMTVVGGGPIGVELAQAYARLGSKVTVIAQSLLPREEPEAGEMLQRVFEKEGITVINSRLSSVEPVSLTDSLDGDDNYNDNDSVGRHHKCYCQNGESVTGTVMLLALGRKPVVDGLGLSNVGIELNAAGGIEVDKNLQTTCRGIYAAGDCTGVEQYTHYAGYQGAVGARNILLPLKDPGMMDFVPGTTFTDPQVASVGLTEEAAKEKYGARKVCIAFKELKETDRAICDNIDEGYIKVVYLKGNYKILGASISSPVAGELIAEISVAMKSKMSFDMLATVIHTYPSHSFALQAMAAELYYEKLVKLKPILNFLKKIGL